MGGWMGHEEEGIEEDRQLTNPPTHPPIPVLPRPNGLALSLDQTKLYIGESTWGNSSWFISSSSSSWVDAPTQPWVEEENVNVGTPIGK